jgi:hypothetical protein
MSPGSEGGVGRTKKVFKHSVESLPGGHHYNSQLGTEIKVLQPVEGNNSVGFEKLLREVQEPMSSWPWVDA